MEEVVITSAIRTPIGGFQGKLDCFSASIDALIQDISMDEWLLQEKERQIQKTKQNAIGSLHEDIMGSIDGVTALKNGNIVDIICENKNYLSDYEQEQSFFNFGDLSLL